MAIVTKNLYFNNVVKGNVNMKTGKSVVYAHCYGFNENNEIVDYSMPIYGKTADDHEVMMALVTEKYSHNDKVELTGYENVATSEKNGITYKTTYMNGGRMKLIAKYEPKF